MTRLAVSAAGILAQRHQIAAIGGIARVYVIPNASITFELTGIKIPRIDDKYEAKYIDWDLGGFGASLSR